MLAKAAGVNVPAGTQLLFAETDANHPFVMEEQMMPFVPIVQGAATSTRASSLRQGGARLPAHGDHPLPQHRQHDSHGARA